VEVLRAVAIRDPDVIERARQLLANIDLLRMSNEVLDDAANLAPGSIRSLDAIHLASARRLRGDLARLVTYDFRMASAAREIGILVDTPGR
jgi:predicted nucleic acid-binding protein